MSPVTFTFASSSPNAGFTAHPYLRGIEEAQEATVKRHPRAGTLPAGAPKRVVLPVQRDGDKVFVPVASG